MRYNRAGAYIPDRISERKSGIFVTNRQNIAILVNFRKWTFEITIQSFEGLRGFYQV